MWAGLGLTIPFVPVFLREQGFTYTQIGQLAFLAAFAGFLTQNFVGAWSDRLQRRKPFIVWGSLALAVVWAIFPYFASYGAFVALYLFSGLAQYSAITTSSALVLDQSPPGQAAHAFAKLRMWGSIGFVVMMALGWVAPGVLTSAMLFRTTPLVYFLAGMAALTVPESRLTAARPARALPWQGFSLLREPGVPLLLLVTFLLQGSLQGATSSLVLWMNTMNADQRIVHLAFVVSATIEIPFMLSIGRWSDRWGRRPWLLVTGVALPIRLLLYSLIVNPAWIPAVQTFHGLTFSVLAVVPMAYMNDVTPEENRAAGQGLLNAVSAGAMAAGPWLVGVLTDALGFTGMYRALAVPAAFAGALMFLFLREPKGPARWRRLATAERAASVEEETAAKEAGTRS